jgi:hypothetical protein
MYPKSFIILIDEEMFRVWVDGQDMWPGLVIRVCTGIQGTLSSTILNHQGYIF